ncbi:oleosin L [Impatiens glandulifera]|uniref:oleosin L n=1 Tax=Impatiens glandulifera TaxID=253017 RepID=UPI001FB05D83|nr:oleosin L [Impatiens glandulifera]
MAALLDQRPTGQVTSSWDDQQPKSTQIVKAVAAVTAGGSLLLFSGLTLAGTVVALALATPLMVIFSPVLVPATITLFMIIAGFMISGGFGLSSLTVFAWMVRYLTGKKPLGAGQLDYARSKIAGKAREMKEKAEQYTGSN